MFYTIFFWCAAHRLLEQSGEMLGILKTELVGYLADAFLSVLQMLLCHIHHFQLNVCLCRTACLLLYQVAKIAWRQAQFACAIFHGGQSVSLGLA